MGFDDVDLEQGLDDSIIHQYTKRIAFENPEIREMMEHNFDLNIRAIDDRISDEEEVSVSEDAQNHELEIHLNKRQKQQKQKADLDEGDIDKLNQSVEYCTDDFTYFLMD